MDEITEFSINRNRSGKTGFRLVFIAEEKELSYTPEQLRLAAEIADACGHIGLAANLRYKAIWFEKELEFKKAKRKQEVEALAETLWPIVNYDTSWDRGLSSTRTNFRNIAAKVIDIAQWLEAEKRYNR